MSRLRSGDQAGPANRASASRAPASVAARVLATAERFGEVEAIVDGDLRLTYAELAGELVRATRAAIAAGVRPGDRAAIWAPNGHRWIIAALGILGAGGVVVPINTRFKGAEAAHVLAASGAGLLFTDREFLGLDYPRMLRDRLTGSGTALPDLTRVVVLAGGPGVDRSWEQHLEGAAEVSEAAARRRIGQVRDTDRADVLFTSGTTGRPKGALSTHGQLLRLFDAWSEIVDLRPRDRYLIVTPFFHSYGYKAGWLASLLRGATVFPMAVFDVAALVALVERERITFLPGPPTLLQEILDFPERDHYDLSSLRTTVTGASTVPVALVERLRSEKVFETVITGYGLTETNGPASICRPDDDPATIAGFAGRAMPDTELAVAGSDGRPVAPGEAGEILVRGYHVMTGYLGDPEATAAAIDADGWLHTGDVGTMDHRGYLKITGRVTDMFIVGGFNVYPAEVESLLLGNGKLIRAAVVGVPDRRLGEVGMAFVVPRPGATIAPGDLLAWARGRMANYKVPRYVEVCDALPTNALGKVVADELRDRAQARAGSTDVRGARVGDSPAPARPGAGQPA